MSSKLRNTSFHIVGSEKLPNVEVSSVFQMSPWIGNGFSVQAIPSQISNMQILVKTMLTDKLPIPI